MFYLFNSRFLTHAVFWVGYYFLFSLIWATEDGGYFASFYLEFILMPVRILAAYCMLYWLIPNFLATQRYRQFAIGYIGLIVIAGSMQLLFSYFFYNQLMTELNTQFTLSINGWLRSIILVNTTVMLLGVLKVFQMYIELQTRFVQLSSEKSNEQQFVEVKADRKIHRLKISDICYLEGMGNYVTYHMKDGQKRVVYVSLKQALVELPDTFIRVHRSYVVNKQQIDSYNHEELYLGDKAIPRGKDISDQDLVVV